MTITERTWNDYIARMRVISETAAQLMAAYIAEHPMVDEATTAAALEYGYALATKYGEASSALACMMYDALVEVSSAAAPAAIPAQTASFGEVAKQLQGTAKRSANPDKIGSAIGRLVKLSAVDTTLNNAIRDGAQVAWIPRGDTCPFCLMLASNGWRKASKAAIKNGHAEHVHANCDCTYAVRLTEEIDVEGYNPDGIYDMLNGMDGISWNDKLNSLHRENYKANKEQINEQKRIAYKERKSQKLVDVTDKVKDNPFE